MANLRLFVGGEVQYFDETGTAVAGGTVYTYDTRTTTPRNGYTDAALTAPATSFPLDGSGKVTMYLDHSAAYRLVVKDSGGNTVETLDDISGVYLVALSGGFDHGTLTGLADDDHTQYLLVDGTRAMAGTLNMNGNIIDNTNVIKLGEIADPGYADADEAWLHAEDVAGITQLHYNTSTHKWVSGTDGWVVARNTTGGAVTKKQVVYVTGSTGQRPEIALADATTNHTVLGLLQDDAADLSYCAVVVNGYLKGVDTSAWTAGDILYLSTTPGALTTTPPTAPDHRVEIGTVIYSHAVNGIIFVEQHETPINDHGELAGLTDDDHTQYLNTTRGDARYYTETELDAGQLDTRYYTETEIDSTVAGLQPLDSDLTAIAALTPTDSNIIVGNGTTWVAESGATARTSLGVAIGTDVQAYDPTIVVDADIGSTVQAHDAGLDSIAGLMTAADKMIYTTASDTYATADLSSFARTVLDDTSATAARTTLGAMGDLVDDTTPQFGGNVDMNGKYFSNAIGVGKVPDVAAVFDGYNTSGPANVVQTSDTNGATVLQTGVSSVNETVVGGILTSWKTGATTASGGVYVKSGYTAGSTNDDCIVDISTENPSASSTVKVRVDPDGDVGIMESPSGSTAIKARLHVKQVVSPATQPALMLQHTGNAAIYQQIVNNVTGTAYTDGLLVGLDASGNGIIKQQESLPLILYTNGTERARINSSGIVTISNSSPKTWSGSSVLQIDTRTNIFQLSNEAYFSNNAYYNTGWKYSATAASSILKVGSGTLEGYVAASGTADTAITWTSGFYMNNAGTLGLGTTTLSTWDNTAIQIGTSSRGFLARASNTINLGYNAYYSSATWKYQSTAAAGLLQVDSGGGIGLYTAASGTADTAITWTSGFYMNSSGHLGVGTTSPSQKLDINDDSIRIRTAKTPASATDTGTQGQICWNSSYIYVCTATNTWVRTTLATW